MIINIINLEGFAVGEAKNYAPVSAYGHRPKSLQLTFERMQPEPRHVHIGNMSGGIEAGKNVAQFFRVFADHASRIGAFIEAS